MHHLAMKVYSLHCGLPLSAPQDQRFQRIKMCVKVMQNATTEGTWKPTTDWHQQREPGCPHPGQRAPLTSRPTVMGQRRYWYESRLFIQDFFFLGLGCDGDTMIAIQQWNCPTTSLVSRNKKCFNKVKRIFSWSFPQISGTSGTTWEAYNHPKWETHGRGKEVHKEETTNRLDLHMPAYMNIYIYIRMMNAVCVYYVIILKWNLQPTLNPTCFPVSS